MTESDHAAGGAVTALAPLTFSVGEYPYTHAIRSAPLTTASGLELTPIDVQPNIAAFRRQIRELEFNACEVAITTYLVAREHGIPLTALPVFLNRKFHHGDIMCRAESGIREPADLNGRRLGVRAWSVTTGAWVRGILAEDYGVDLSSITWMVDDEEHVETLQLPGNVRHVSAGTSVAQMFADGEIDAALSGRAGIGRTGAPSANWEQSKPTPAQDAYPLFADAAERQRAWYERTGAYPIHGVLTLKTESLQRFPQLARDLWTALSDAKHEFLARVADPTDDETEVARYRAQAEIVGSDPLPFGIEANRASIETIIRFSHDQGMLRATPAPEDVFIAVE